MSDKKLFPEFLNKGSKGPPVSLLQTLLLDRSIGTGALMVDGEYGDETARAVQELQEDLDVEPDGNFGPETREAMQRQTGFDINAIPASVFVGETVPVGP